MHVRGALSVSDAMQFANVVKHAQAQRTRLAPADNEKHPHTPLSPMTFRSSAYVQEDDGDSDGSTSPFETPSIQSPRSLKDRHGESVVRSPVVIDPTDSFMDLAENNHGMQIAILSSANNRTALNILIYVQKWNERLPSTPWTSPSRS